MLVLTRKQQERIVIGGNVVVTVVRIKGNAVRIGIEAPDDVRITRGEITGAEKSSSERTQPAAKRHALTVDLGGDDSDASSTMKLIVGRRVIQCGNGESATANAV